MTLVTRALPHLEALEAEAIHIIREVAAELEKPVLLYSGGKDSIVLSHLAAKAFAPGVVPVPGHARRHGAQLPRGDRVPRPRASRSSALELIVASVQESIDAGRATEETGPRASRNRLQTVTLLDAIAAHGFDAAFGGARRDEERSRAKERVLSFRDDFGQWDPRRQRPELWDLYNGRVRRGEHVRAFPLSNWTELDVWEYIAAEQHRAALDLLRPRARGVRARRDALRGLRARRAPRRRGRRSSSRVRYRTVGDLTVTGAVRSTADDARRRSWPRSPPRAITERGETRADDRASRRRHGRPQARGVLLDMLRVATAGSVDDGKSTLIGRLLFDSKSLMADQEAGLEDLALLTDGLRAEREQGITIDVAYRHFATPRRRFVLARLPGPRAVHAQHGHRRLDRRPRADPRRRAPRADRPVAPPPGDRRRCCGVPQITVCVNKMDLVGLLGGGASTASAARCSSSPPRWSLHDLTFIPVSALRGRQRRRALRRGCPGTAAIRCSSTSRRRPPGSAAPAPPRRRRGCRSSCVIRDGETRALRRPPVGRHAARRATRSSSSRPACARGSARSTARAASRAEAFSPMSVAVGLEDDVDVAPRRPDRRRRRARREAARELSATLCWLGDAPARPGGRYLLKHTDPHGPRPARRDRRTASTSRRSAASPRPSSRSTTSARSACGSASR